MEERERVRVVDTLLLEAEALETGEEVTTVAGGEAAKEGTEKVVETASTGRGGAAKETTKEAAEETLRDDAGKLVELGAAETGADEGVELRGRRGLVEDRSELAELGGRERGERLSMR